MAPIRPLAWEPPYAKGAALEKTKQTNKQTNKHWKLNLQALNSNFNLQENTYQKHQEEFRGGAVVNESD